MIDPFFGKRAREKGVTTVEYIVMFIVIAVGISTATPGLAPAIKGALVNLFTTLSKTR